MITEHRLVNILILKLLIIYIVYKKITAMSETCISCAY